MAKIDGSSIGERIRMIRQAKSLTQEELGSRAGLTKGFISQVERNLTSLSVESLFGILDALDQKASTFFDEGFDEKIVFGTDDRVELEKEHVTKFEILVAAAQNREMDPALLELDAGEKTEEEEPHEGEEFGFVLSGGIEVILGVKTYQGAKGRVLLLQGFQETLYSEQAKDEGIGPVGIFAS